MRGKKLFLLDMDGTIYLDDHVFSGTLPFLQQVRAQGGRYLFLTNNSSRGVSDYVAKLARLGIPAVPEDFVTSVDAMISFLERRYGPSAARQKRIYLMGTESFRRQMEEAGFRILTSLSAEENDRPMDAGNDRTMETVDILIAGFDRELTFQKLEDASRLLTAGTEYFATNPDWVCPTAWGAVPDCGSICQMLEHATGRLPYFVGKPQPDMVYLALKKTGCAPEDAVLIGDRLYTDIACGVNAGIDTIFVLSGEGTLEDLETSDVQPAYIFNDIGEVFGKGTGNENETQ
ncbi:MAG: HAD-IIA family hydrolase [Anaerovoracaceae bacterium]